MIEQIGSSVVAKLIIPWSYWSVTLVTLFCVSVSQKAKLHKLYTSSDNLVRGLTKARWQIWDLKKIIWSVHGDYENQNV